MTSTATPTAKTACSGHRTMGLAIINGVWACRACRLPASQHETADETVARRAAESQR